MPRRYASIDVGTNTLRLLIADPDSKSKYRPIYRDRIITRLGGRFTEWGGIDKIAAQRTIDALMGFSRSLSRFNVNSVKAVGTSVLRRANNRGEFLDEVFKKTRVRIEVISGGEEARLTLKGVLLVVGSGSRFVVIDIGGGSTEYIFGNEGEERGAYSLEMGVVSLTEEFLTSDPPTSEELLRLEKRIEKDMIEELPFFSDGKAILIGTAGTPTTLAAMDLGLEVYQPERVNGHRLPINRLRSIYSHLSHLTITERRKIPTLERGREDLIISGIAIILKTMNAFGFKEMIVSDSGLLEGVLLELLNKEYTSLGGGVEA